MSKILCRNCGEVQGEFSEYGTGPNISPIVDALNVWYCVSCMHCGFTGESARSTEQAELNFRPVSKEENKNSAPLEELLQWCEQKMIDCRAIADPDDALSCELAECGFHDFMSMRDEVALRLRAACPAEKLTADICNTRGSSNGRV